MEVAMPPSVAIFKKSRRELLGEIIRWWFHTTCWSQEVFIFAASVGWNRVPANSTMS